MFDFELSHQNMRLKCTFIRAKKKMKDDPLYLAVKVQNLGSQSVTLPLYLALGNQQQITVYEIETERVARNGQTTIICEVHGLSQWLKQMKQTSFISPDLWSKRVRQNTPEPRMRLSKLIMFHREATQPRRLPEMRPVDWKRCLPKPS